ncbi:MAG: relaxase/mobilization nuclease, partial [Defluviitaleaceae bacterium]|nr:relaxase/mobilization nuclease [Defluviitaleaceae bacterium]
DISVRPPGKERFFRLERNFGEEYSRQGIFRQMRAQGRPTFPEPEPKRRPASVARLNGNLRTVKKLTGFRALYFHYMYLMGKLPREHPRPPAKVHFLFREDLIQIDKISNEIKLLCRHRIDTSEQLFSYKSGVTERMETLTAERAGLRRQLRRLTDESDRAPVRTRIALLSAALGEARKEVALCDDIASRTAQIKAKIQAVRQEQQPQEKIRKREEVIR